MCQPLFTCDLIASGTASRQLLEVLAIKRSYRRPAIAWKLTFNVTTYQPSAPHGDRGQWGYLKGNGMKVSENGKLNFSREKVYEKILIISVHLHVQCLFSTTVWFNNTVVDK